MASWRQAGKLSKLGTISGTSGGEGAIWRRSIARETCPKIVFAASGASQAEGRISSSHRDPPRGIRSAGQLGRSEARVIELFLKFDTRSSRSCAHRVDFQACHRSFSCPLFGPWD
jgi:hypothetical protein